MPFYLGNNRIIDPKIGNNKVSKILLGSTPIY